MKFCEADREEILDALQVAIAAWDAQTTQDGLAAIGLTGDIVFPVMPRAVKSISDARNVLRKHRPRPTDICGIMAQTPPRGSNPL